LDWITFSIGLITIVGILFGIIQPIWKHRKEVKQARVNRILQPLREIDSKLRNLELCYAISDYLHFYSDLEQLNRSIEKYIIDQRLDYDIIKESNGLVNHLMQLRLIYLKAKETYYAKRIEMSLYDTDNLNRLFDQHRMELFQDQTIKHLVDSLSDELGKWLREHS